MAEQISLPVKSHVDHGENAAESALLRPTLDEDRQAKAPPETSSNEKEIAKLAALVRTAQSAQEFDTIAQRAEILSPFSPDSRAYKLLIQTLEKRLKAFCDDIDGFLAGGLDAALARLILATRFAKSKSLEPLIRQLCAADQNEAASCLIDALLRVDPLAQGCFNLTLFVGDEAQRTKLQDGHSARLRERALKQLVVSLQRARRVEDLQNTSIELPATEQGESANASASGAAIAKGSPAEDEPPEPQSSAVESVAVEQQAEEKQAAKPFVPELETGAGYPHTHVAETALHGDAQAESMPGESKLAEADFLASTKSDTEALSVADHLKTPPELSVPKQDEPQSVLGVVAAPLTSMPEQGDRAKFITAATDYDRAVPVEAVSSEPHRAEEHAKVYEAEEAFFDNRLDAAEALAKSALTGGLEIASPERMRLHNVIARCRIARGDGVGAIDAIKVRANDCRSERQADDLAVQSLLAGGELEHAFLAYWADGITSELRACGLRSAGLQTLRQARSSGQKIKGTCGIVCTDGLGGEFRMIQMLPDIARLFEKLVVICDARSVETLQRNFPYAVFHGRDECDPTQELSADYARFIDRKGLQRLRQCDFVADLNQFAAIVRSSVQDFLMTPKVVEASPWLRVKWELHLGMSRQHFPLLGLCWRQDSNRADARLRQSSLSDWLVAFQGINVRIVPLQADVRDDEMALLRNHPHVVQLPEDFHTRANIEDTLALLSALPLIVSVPGTIQEISGGAGLRTLCPAHPFDARWLRRPGSIHDLWSSSTIIIAGSPDEGLAGSIALTAKVLAHAVTR